MEQLLMRLGELVVGFLGLLGPLVFLLLFLRFRNQREEMFFTVVLKELNSPDLRGLFAVRVRCGLFFRHDRVAIDLWNCSNNRIWQAIMALSPKLPPGVWLVVEGFRDRHSKSPFRLKVRRDSAGLSHSFRQLQQLTKRENIGLKAA